MQAPRMCFHYTAYDLNTLFTGGGYTNSCWVHITNLSQTPPADHLFGLFVKDITNRLDLSRRGQGRISLKVCLTSRVGMLFST